MALLNLQFFLKALYESLSSLPCCLHLKSRSEERRGSESIVQGYSQSQVDFDMAYTIPDHFSDHNFCRLKQLQGRLEKYKTAGCLHGENLPTLHIQSSRLGCFLYFHFLCLVRRPFTALLVLNYVISSSTVNAHTYCIFKNTSFPAREIRMPFKQHSPYDFFGSPI